MKKKIVIISALLALSLVIIVLSRIKICNCSPYPKLTHVKANIIILNSALDEFRQLEGFYPNQVNGLNSLVEDCGIENWNGPYLTKPTLPKDSWGNDYYYDLINGIPVVISAGEDGVLGTQDDIETSRRLKIEANQGMDPTR